MEKFCVFCGNKPENKNLEHIIPEWLIKLTGDFDRPIKIGPIWDSKNGHLTYRDINFSNFAFPSCKACNDNYTNLEGQVSTIVRNILLETPISSEEFSTLLTWFDKVRVGLWLAYHYLQKNSVTIDPHYHITKRIDKTDRALFIYKSDFIGQRLFFIGAALPIFQYYPCCFGLVINNFHFINISTHYLVSRGLGLPYATKQTFTENDNALFRVSDGKCKIIHPILRNPISLNGSIILQPIIPRELGIKPEDYDTEFIKNNFTFNEKGIGDIFLENNSINGNYSSLNKTAWIPKINHNDNILYYEFVKGILKRQISMSNNVSYGQISEIKKQTIKWESDFAKKISRKMMTLLEPPNDQ